MWCVTVAPRSSATLMLCRLAKRAQKYGSMMGPYICIYIYTHYMCICILYVNIYTINMSIIYIYVCVCVYIHIGYRLYAYIITCKYT